MKTATASSTLLAPRTGRPAHVCAFDYARSLSAMQAARNLSSMGSVAALATSKAGQQWDCADRAQPGEASA